MPQDLQDIYSDYLIAQNPHATATGLSSLLPDELSHDKVTRFLNGKLLDSKALWQEVKSDVRRHESLDDGVLILDDMVGEKPYTDENEIISWHYSHGKGRVTKGINILSSMVRYDDLSFPTGYEIIKKEIQFCDIKTKRERRKSAVTKNEHFRQLLSNALHNRVKYKYVLGQIQV